MEKKAGRRDVLLVTQNERMRGILTRLETIAASDRTVLLIGETGVGKEIFSDFLHYNSARAGKAFVKIGLANVPTELLESELFGHEKGSFTSAEDARKGLFEIATGGTVFLDDIDDVPLHIQKKLLRVLESQELMRIGGSVTIPIDIRLIAATKVDLKILVDQGRFRADLYYRLNVIPVDIPPLRERADDIPLLVQHLLDRYAPDARVSFSEDALAAMRRYAWPGNIRELRNIVQRLAVFADDTVEAADLPAEIRGDTLCESGTAECERCFAEGDMSMDEVTMCLESTLIRNALRDHEGNVARAAKLLRIHPSTLRDKMRKHGIRSADKE